MHLDAAQVALLVVTGLAAGAINTAAGGGSLISFPVLVAVGYPAFAANVTNTVALCPGYLGGALGYRPELRGQRRRIAWLGGAGVLGSVAGAVLLATTSQGIFRDVVPVLVLFACGLLAAQPALNRWLRSRGAGRERRRLLFVLQLPAGAYGAYFGAALGVVLLALLGIFIEDTLQRLNALKGLLSLIVNWVAAAYFIAFEPVHWPVVAILAPSSLIGGRAGVLLARRLSDRTLRRAVIAFGLVAVAYLIAAR